MKKLISAGSGVGISGATLGVVAEALKDHPVWLALTVVLAVAVVGLIMVTLVREQGRQRRSHDVQVTLAAARVYQAGGDGAAVVRALRPTSGPR